MKIKFEAQEIAAAKGFKTVFGVVTDQIGADVTEVAMKHTGVAIFMKGFMEAYTKAKESGKEVIDNPDGPSIIVTHNEDGSIEVESDPVIIVEILNITSQMMNKNVENISGMTVSGLMFLNYMGMWNRINRIYKGKIKDFTESITRRIVGK